MGKLDTKTWALIPIAVAINVAMGWACACLPLYFDSIGTILVAVLAGPWAGAIAGAVSNIIASLQSPVWLRYLPVAIMIGILAGFLPSLGLMRRGYLAIIGGLFIGVISACIAAPITAFCGGASGSGTDVVLALFRGMGMDSYESCFAGALCVDPPDKVVSVFLIQILVAYMPLNLRLSFPQGEKLADIKSLGTSLWKLWKSNTEHGERVEFTAAPEQRERPAQKQSWLHRVSPSTKITLIVCCTLCVFFVPAWQMRRFPEPYWYPLPYYPILLGLLFTFAASAGVQVAVGRLLMVSALPLGTVAILFNGIWGKEGITYLGNLQFSIQGAFDGYGIACAIALIVESIGLLIFTTPWSELVAYFEQEGLPRKLCYVLTASLNFIPTMHRRVAQIREAQAARALPYGRSLRNRFRFVIAVIMPLLTVALTEANERAIALEMRGFGASTKRTAWKRKEYVPYDSDLQILIVLIFVYLAWYLWKRPPMMPH